MNALNGKVAGVQINSSAAGVGGAARVVMRGAKSLYKDNNALYVIDGIPMSNVSFGSNDDGLQGNYMGSDGVADINPDDIESISVLTGPSAAALVGDLLQQHYLLVAFRDAPLPEYLRQCFRVLPELGRQNLAPLRSRRILQHGVERQQLPDLLDGYAEAPDLFFGRDDQCPQHPAQQRLQPLQLHVPRRHQVPQRQADRRSECELHPAGQQEHDRSGQILQPAAGALSLSARRRL